MIKGMKIGGRCAVIIPDGVLFGSSKAHKKNPKRNRRKPNPRSRDFYA